MGNESSTTTTFYPTKETENRSKISQYLRSKFRKDTAQDRAKSKDKFIIEHLHKNKNNDCQLELDQRRLVFVSLIGLYQSWKRVPSASLYVALLLMPLKRKWIYEPEKYTQELQAMFIQQITVFEDVSERIYLDVNETQHFIQLLQWKDSQGLVLWMLDYPEYGTQTQDNNPLIAPFWYSFNDKLSSLYDHITQQKYEKIEFDEKWWQNTFVSKYGTKASSILSELYFVTMKFKTLQEIVYQSNAKSLHPIIYYENKSKKRMSLPVLVDQLSDAIFNEERVLSPLSPIIEAVNKESDSRFKTPGANAYVQSNPYSIFKFQKQMPTTQQKIV